MTSYPAAQVASVSQATSGMNAYSGVGQTQMGASGAEVALTSQGSDKGGMRGLGLLAVVLAEIALKKKVIGLSEDYYTTNKKDYDFFKANHQAPMQATAQEAFGPLNPTYKYDLYASVPAGIAKAGVIDRQWYEARRRLPKYHIGQMERLDYDMAVARAAGVAAGWNLAIRYELNWTDEHNNRAMDRKMAVANMGIGVGNIVQQGLSASVANLSTAYDRVGDTIASIGNGYAMNKGYQQGRTSTAARFQSELPKGMQ